MGLPYTQAYCSLLGQNPGFSTPPKVEQVTLTSVRVTWEGIVTRIECADQFIVKSWNARNPNDYQMSDLLPTTQFSYVVTDLVPNQNYVFQAVAREDKGILGKDWNKSPQALFRTSRNNPTVPPNSDNTYLDPTMVAPSNSSNNPFSLFSMGGIVIGIIFAALILVGICWNLIQKSRRKKTADTDSVNSDSETDSMDLDLENTDLESRVGSIRPSSRAPSRVSTIKNGTVRSRVRSPRRFSLTPSEPPDQSHGPIIPLDQSYGPGAVIPSDHASRPTTDYVLRNKITAYGKEEYPDSKWSASAPLEVSKQLEQMDI